MGLAPKSFAKLLLQAQPTCGSQAAGAADFGAKCTQASYCDW